MKDSTSPKQTETKKAAKKLLSAQIFNVSFTQGSLPAGIVATGGQGGTAFNLAGRMVPANSPRIDFGNTYFPYGDPARINLVLQANNFSSSSWLQKTNGPSASLQLTANAGISPDGSKDATQLVASASGSNNNIQSQVKTLS
jgi:hypothetical protein